MAKSASSQRFSVGVFLTAFLIGGVSVYFAMPLLPSTLGGSCNHEHVLEEDAGHNHEDAGEVCELEHIHTEEGDEREGIDVLALNLQALTNIGIEQGESGMITLAPSDFSKYFSFPGYVRYKPGHSLIDVPAPASGVVTRIYAEEGEALCPGEPLFEIQLTHEELASCQLELLSLLRKQDLLESENERLSRLAEGIEPRAQREVELQLKENASAMETQKQALRFLGVSEQALKDTVVKNRNLLTTLIVRVPQLDLNSSGVVLEFTDVHTIHSKDHFREIEHYLQLEKLFVEKGQTVSLGDSLGVVSDLRELWIEGKAFESDQGLINDAYSQRKKIRAVFNNALDFGAPDLVEDLSIRSVSNRLDSMSRTFACYIDLKNYVLNSPEDLIDERKLENNEATSKAPLLNWRFKPGQRCEIEIKTETLSDVFVVPVSAVAQDGNQSFLFEYVGNENEKPIWRKRPVVVAHRTSREVVVANNGSIKVGAKIAKRGAHQLYIALTSGGGQLQSACPCDDENH